MRRILLIIVAILFYRNIFAQNKFCVKIILATNIDPQKISYTYNDGKSDIYGSDPKKDSFIVAGNFYSQFVPLQITYLIPYPTVVNLFISDKPSRVYLYLSSEKQLKCRTDSHTKIIWDTANKACKDIIESTKKINQNISAIWEKYGSEIGHNDSLTKLVSILNKQRTKAALSAIRKNPDNFFSFWYFRNQIIESSLSLSTTDTSYLKGLLLYFQSVFPSEYTESIEGKAIIQQLEGYIHPLQTKVVAPEFFMKDIDGRGIDLNDFRGKYVLIDFWATWCPPCINEIPFIKKIRKNYPYNKLAIIGVSWDRDSTQLRKVIIQKDMTWPQIFDRGADIINLYGVHAIPQLFLINKKGMIIYKSGERGDNRQELLDILNGS